MEKLTITRIFKGSKETVWQAFTDPNILVVWWAPDNMKSHGIQVDLKVGGEFRFCFVGEDNANFWGRGIYQKIEKPNFISYLDTFCDSEGNPVPPSYYGLPGEEIIEALIELSFSSSDQMTKLTLVMDNHYDEKMTEETRKGWHSMFDKLDRVLEKN
jgi:uncharacterized protein YndB with AHSA1/START domain